ncbi:hypothetical protein V8V91_13495 [Algoriphagus halophilus]|uniref:hypothetical protein n=1 Tax=Algoriphagus halophilus TaxID=226505 RepID=UPI00358FAC1F
MKKIQLLIFALFFSLGSMAQNADSKFYFGFDASYWQRSLHQSDPLAVQRNMLGSIRPMVGFKLQNDWSIGILSNFSSYQSQVSPIEFSYPIYGEPDENEYYPIIGSRNVYQEASMKNNLRGYGLFLKKFISLGKKTSLNFNLYGLKESGKDGNIVLAPDLGFYFPCPYCEFEESLNDYCATCLSIAYFRREIPMKETNWRVGMDLAFAYQWKTWISMEIRANLLEYRKQILKDKREINHTIDFAYDPFYGASTQYFGNHTDFGSAVARDGVRFGLIFSPF